MKSQKITKVITIHPEGDTKFHENSKHLNVSIMLELQKKSWESLRSLGFIV